MINLENGTYSISGVLFWKTNNRPVPMSFFADNDLAVPEGQKQANDTYTAEAIKEYRTNRAKGPSDEGRILRGGDWKFRT